MADVYCDQELGDGSDNGTSWINAYKVLATALNGSNVVAGDILWVKGNFATSGAATFKGVATFTTNPPQVIGCLSATEATPPATSDIIPGLRTGQSTLAYDHANAPTLTITTASADMIIEGYMRMYGLVLKSRDNVLIGAANETGIFIEECEFRAGDGEAGLFFMGTSTTSPHSCFYKNCKISAGTDGNMFFQGRGSFLEFHKCIFDIPGNVITPGESTVRHVGTDFTAQSSTLVVSGGGIVNKAGMKFSNCSIHASTSLVTGSVTEKFRLEFAHVSAVGSKTTGQSFREIDIITDNGNIVEEVTGVRSGGADDGGSGGWSYAYTPIVNGTRNNREGLIGPWTNKQIAGDGTSKNLTIFIANNEGVDYQTDDVHAEVFFPSATGTADYDLETDQLDLQASATDITDDVVSSWTTPAANPQKFVIAIAPDYTGWLRWRVIFTRNFGSSPKTLYVDGLATIA